jgi:outer membrane protein OmpA-like peptidoglycan-associated protein
LPGTDGRPGVVDTRRIEEMRDQRRERVEGGRTVIEEPDRRQIVRENNRVIIRHDETERFRRLGGEVQVERAGRGGETRTVFMRPDGIQIITVQSPDGRLIRRIRRTPDGREFILVDNNFGGRPPGPGGFIVNLPPPRIALPREQYIVPMETASEDQMVEVFEAPPMERVARRYTLDEVRYNYNLRARMREVELNTITFETGSWEVLPDQVPLLERMAAAVLRVIERNPNEIFLIEGHTDATGNDVDNLSLSDRRASSVAVVLTESFRIPAENLTTQGYGSQNLKVPTGGAERANRRVTIRRITPLIAGGAPPAGRPAR